MTAAHHQVIVAGGGPTGMMLAGELALGGVDVAVVERRVDQALAGVRAGGLHARTIEVLDQRGIAGPFIAAGQKLQVVGFNGTPLDISDFPTRHNYELALTQNHIERLLAEWLSGLAVTAYRGVEVAGLAQHEAGVVVTLSDGRVLHADWLVGADGGRSFVRKAAGIAFPGHDAGTSWLLGEVETAAEPKWGATKDARGTHGIGRAGPDGPVRMVLTEATVGTTAEPTLDDLKAALVAIYGTDFGVHAPTYLGRFTDAARQAAAYRSGRVLLAGDAAHIHAPIGGQGLNLGIQDAVNLGWKLAAVARGEAPDTLLDSYHAERHPVAARVLATTLAQAALRQTDDRTTALAAMIAELVVLDEPRKRLAGEFSGLGLCYDFGEGHKLLGRRMPDLDLTTGAGPVRMFSLLHAARPVLLDLGGGVTAGGWADRVRRVAARHDGAWELPVIGRVAAPDAVLVRPDGYVAWVGAGSDAGLVEALARWCGPALTDGPAAS